MRPKTAAEVRALLQNRAAERPRSELPMVQITDTTATLRLFDSIDSYGEWWGMSAKEFAQVVDGLPAGIGTIELLINSPGGDAYDGVAIMNVMRAHPARTVAVVQGVAASAASFIACAADETIMAPNSTMMIHDAWGVCVGNTDDMLAVADMLDLVSGQMAEVYAAKSGQSVDEVRELMKAETWFTAAEAVAAGLADQVSATSAPDPEPSVSSARWSPADVKELAAALAEFGALTPSAGEREVTPTERTVSAEVDQEQAARLLASLTLTQGETNE